ncbi:purine-nucleoside phosphorylase [Bryobacter aggregatus]|uniref:purine-nucleoside phosphorylase n=1 Tax=Bryobacter aggregatus TaxID=360054 RepID=UPI0004E11D6C|nr:purine-nucleoside phosphorylase [Bryobacter aggregatus]
MTETIAALKSRLSALPEVAIVLGSGLGPFAEEVEDAVVIPYEEIPGWPRSTAVGHAGKLVFGTVAGRRVAVMSGRAHLYEGHPIEKVVLGVRVLAQLGARKVILTNAAGGINLSFSRGALVLMTDHINLQGANPLSGPNDDSLGPRFPDMTFAYAPRFRALALEHAKRLGIPLHQGVYAALAGPSYETPAEIRYLRIIGADLVGMSTVPEVIALNHMGAEVLGISCVTNMAAGVTKEKINHEEVIETGNQVRGQFIRLLQSIIPSL